MHFLEKLLVKADIEQASDGTETLPRYGIVLKELEGKTKLSQYSRKTNALALKNNDKAHHKMGPGTADSGGRRILTICFRPGTRYKGSQKYAPYRNEMSVYSNLLLGSDAFNESY